MTHECQPVELRAALLDAIAFYGTDGWDEEGLLDDLEGDGHDRAALEAELIVLRHEGLVIDLGCSFVALTRAAWIERAKREIQGRGLADRDEIVEAVVKLLVVDSRPTQAPTRSELACA